MEKVYRNRTFSSLAFARLLSDLAKKLDEFLLHDAIRMGEPKRNREILQIYNERKLSRYFNEAWTNAQTKHNKQTIKEADFYLQEFQLEASRNIYYELQNQRSGEKNILQTLDALDKFYFIHKLSYFAALLHYKKFLSTGGEVLLAKEILESVKNSPIRHVPAIAINYCVVLSLLEPDKEEHFQNLRTLLHKHLSTFSKENARNFYAFAINFCIRKINFGELDYVNELFDLYKEMLKSELLTDEQGWMSEFDFKNIVTVSLRADDAVWTEKFIREYKNSIPYHKRQNAYTFNQARLYFHRKKFDKVLPLLQEVAYSDIFYQLDSKTTLIKTYYELGEYLPLMALKENFRIMLRRKKIISEQNRINYMNFLRLTTKLFRADVKDVKTTTALKKHIQQSTNIADKGWLMEKVNELMPD